MVENEKIFERIKELITNYSSEHRLKINKLTEDRFKDCLSRAVVELKKFVDKESEDDVIIILRNDNVKHNDGYISSARMYIAKRLWDKIYGEEECTTE